LYTFAVTANNPAGIAICGLGTFPPRDATLEALRELSGCRPVFADFKDPASLAFLKRALGPLRRPRSAAEIVAAAERGRAGLAVWGHAAHTSPLAGEVRALAARRGVAVRVLGSLSPVSTALALGRMPLGWDRRSVRGLRSLPLSAVLARPESARGKLPLVVYAEAAPEADWKRLARAGALARLSPQLALLR
jgi:hypothetical protein